MKKSIISFIIIFILVTLSCDKDILKPKSITLATLKGNVIESVNQTPLSGVTVNISNYTESVQTDSLGQYTLQVELETSTSSEQVTLTTWKSGYIPLQIKDLTIKANKTALVPTISMTPVSVEQGNYIAGVSGNVVDEYENPLEEVLITISGHAEHSYTDSSGFFSFEVGIDNTPKNVTIDASRVGYKPRSIENVTLEANKMTLIPTFSMTPVSVEQGNYIAGISGNVVDEYENPLEEVLIIIPGHAEHSHTDSSGFFSFEIEIENTSENVTVNASKVGYNPRSIENVTLEANKTALMPTFSMNCNSYIVSVSGNVVDEYENPLEEVLITISGHADHSYTDSSGFFSFEFEIDNTSENITINASKIGYKPCSIENVTLEANKMTLIPTISMTPVSVEQGNYIAGISGNIVDEYENPLEEVLITISGHADHSYTDSSGFFSFEVGIDNTTENVTVNASKVGYNPRSIENITLEANETVIVPTISLIPEIFTAYIEGTIIDNVSGNPLEGAQITISNHVETGFTDSSGAFSFPVEISNSTENVTLTAQKVGYSSSEVKDLTLKANATVTVPTISLIPEVFTTTIQGQVIDSLENNPLEGALISVPDHYETGITDANGNYNFSLELSSSPENVTVNVTKPFYTYADPGVASGGGMQVTLKHGQTTTVPTFVLKPCIAYIEGMVIDIDSSAVESVLISISNHAATSLTDATGKFSFSVEISSTIENVTVIATKPFYQEAQYSVTLEYDQTTVVPTFVLKLLP